MIGGNQIATLEKKTTFQNSIGEDEETWETIDILEGYLDFLSGESKYDTYNAKIQESTHVFIMDFKPIDKKAINKRLMIEKEVYEITLIDDPMNLHKHIEIYLKYTGE